MTTTITAIPARKLINEVFSGDRTSFAEAAGGASIEQVNNWVSQGREFLPLANGDFVMMSQKLKVVKSPFSVSDMEPYEQMLYAEELLKVAGFSQAQINQIALEKLNSVQKNIST